MTREVIDTEMTGLLDSSSIDYTASPHKLKSTFKAHCLVQRNIDDPTIVKKYVGMDEIKAWAYWELPKITTFVAHNGIDYDLMALKLLKILNYEISLDPKKPSTINGKPVDIVDTLVVSKCLNPDRFGGHSLDEWGKRVGMEKIDWRAEAIQLGLIEPTAPKGAEFLTYHPDMLTYCERDTEVNVKVYWALIAEMEDWDWTFPLWLEHAVRDVVTRQSHRGFRFNRELADANVRYLDKKMEEIRLIVEPLLPPKPMGVTKLKEFIPPKVQFKKNGEPNKHIENWVAKHNGTLTKDGSHWYAQFPDSPKHWQLPMSQDEPIQTHEPSKITDTTHIKGWLVELGWQPTQYKERDLTCDSKKKKLPLDKFHAAVDRWIEQTLNSPFGRDRLEALETTRSRVREYLMKWDAKRPLKVYTNPTITVGMDKEIDPQLLKLADKFPHAKLVSEYLTYAHRRNSILGGGVDPDDVDDDDEFAGKGYLASERITQDGRIPTPADSCGAGTSRFKHRLVANIPRITSLYGGEMREMFGSDVEAGYYQLGYDFASLEAMIESHYCRRYDPTGEYCESLVLEKPNDVHTKTAAKISQEIGQPFSRQSAKPVKYACVPMDTQALTRRGWKHYHELNIGDEVLGYNQETGSKEWTTVEHLFKQQDEVVEFGHKWFKVRATKDHRWFVKQRREFSTGNSCKSIRKAVNEVRTTIQLNSESNIVVNAPMNPHSDRLSSNQLYVAGSKRNFNWTTRVLQMSQPERVAFLEGFMIADGYCQEGRWQWSQNTGELAEAALLATYLVHDGVVQVRNVTDSPSPMINCILGKTSHRTMQTTVMTSQGVQDVWCMQTGLGSWVMRQGNTITITGNCAYGAQPPRVAKTVGCSLELGAKIHAAYWESARPLALLGEKLKDYWSKTGGKKFILGLDGRKIPTRSASALINSLFQSAGVICAKLAMVMHERKLREEGLVVDFFEEDWQNKAFVQQMIAYHDEAQMEVHKSLIKWKFVPVKSWEDEEEVEAAEKELKEFKANNPGWSEIGHSDKACYIGYCRAGELIQEVVKEVSKFFKLNVTLSADYILGRNWGECH